MEKLGKLKKESRGDLAGLFHNAEEVWQNKLYYVGVYREKAENGEMVIRLSIKCREKSPDNKLIEPSWEDKQEIKNRLVGEEFEGVELYPVETRKNTQAHQTHLWIIENRTFRFPFGWRERATFDDDAVGELAKD